MAESDAPLFKVDLDLSHKNRQLNSLSWISSDVRFPPCQR